MAPSLIKLKMFSSLPLVIACVSDSHVFEPRVTCADVLFLTLHFSLLTRESIGKEAELEMKLAIVSNALMKVSDSVRMYTTPQGRTV